MAVGVGDVVEVVCEFSYLLQRVMNVWHFVNVGDSIADDEALLDVAEVVDGLYDYVDGIQSASLIYSSVLARNINDNVDLGQTDWPTRTAGGIATGTTLPSQVAALITFPTIIPKKRGRKFIPGMDETRLASGRFDATALTALENMAAQVLNNIAATASTWRYYVVPTVAPLGAQLPTEALVTDVPSTLTRRRIGTGE